MCRNCGATRKRKVGTCISHKERALQGLASTNCKIACNTFVCVDAGASGSNMTSITAASVLRNLDEKKLCWDVLVVLFELEDPFLFLMPSEMCFEVSVGVTPVLLFNAASNSAKRLVIASNVSLLFVFDKSYTI